MQLLIKHGELSLPVAELWVGNGKNKDNKQIC